MSIDAYKVAVQISLVENVTRGLGLMARHFKSTDAQASILQKRLESIGKMTLIGGAMAGAGALGLSMFKAPLEEAMKYEKALASLRQMGLGDAQIADAQKFVAANAIIGTSLNERMRLFTEAQGSFRQSGMNGGAALTAAKTMTPILAMYEVASGMLSGAGHEAAQGNMRNLNKTVEMMGGLGDTKRAAAIADGMFKASQSSGRMVDERQLKQFFAYGSSATNQQDLRTVFGGLEPIIGELGGSTTGTGLRTAFNRVNGMMALMPHRTQAELQRLGIADGSGKQQTTERARMQATNLIGYTQKIMSRYQGAGITSQVDRERENAILFGTNGAKVMNKVMSQMPVLTESLAAYDRAKGTKAVVNNPANKALLASMNLEKKKEDLELHIGQVALPYFVKALKMVSDVLDRVNAFATKNPAAFKGMVLLFGAISAAALVGGGLTLMAAAFRGFALLSPLLGPGTRLLGAILPRLIQTMMFLFEGVVGGAMAFGRSLLLIFSPIGLTIAAVAVAAWLVYNNWKEIKTALGLIWGSICDGVVKLFHGDILGAFLSFSGALIRGFQTLFNTIIAGVNTILPSAMQLSKFKFADDYDAWVKSHPAVNAGAQGGGKAGNVYLDGRLVGKHVAPHVTQHQAHQANRPNAGPTGFNTGRGMLQPGG
jgi:hypothetical protein